MAFKYSGDATLGVSLTVETSKPLDNRTVVDKEQELYSIPEKYAYQGMTVSNVDNGNIYMLVDKAKINSKEGWKASYESIQIITCTQSEYDEWKTNTTDDFKAVDSSKTFLHSDTYYYIYEDSIDENQEYLSASWGKQIEEQLKQKALNTTVTALGNQLDETISSLSKYATLEELTSNYATSETVAATYATQQSMTELSEQIASTYVTKESLKGESTDDDFIFVTQRKYQEDQTAAAEAFTTKALTADTVTTPTLNLQELSLTNQDNELAISGKAVALKESVPVVKVVSEEEYNNMTSYDENTYYCTYGDTSLQDTGYVRSEYLTEKYYTKDEVDALIKEAVQNAIAELNQTTT